VLTGTVSVVASCSDDHAKREREVRYLRRDDGLAGGKLRRAV
jgi:hypothetical protein